MSDFVVVGAGVAGAVAARRLLSAGYRVAVVASGEGASHAPVAIVNPVRAKRAKPVPRAREALAEAARFYQSFGRLHFGLYHLLDEEKRERLAKTLPESGLEYHFEENRLFLPEAFWLWPRPLLAALLAGIPLYKDRVVSWEKDRAYLASGRELKGTLVFAGGAEGAGMLESAPSLSAGSLLLVAEPGDGGIAEVFHAGGAIGGSYRPLKRYQAWTLTQGELEELSQKARALLGRPPTLLGSYSGVRYRHESPLREERGAIVLAGLGSTGFLMAPLLTRELLARL